MQNAHLDVQQRINPLLAQLAAKRGLPIVATGDVHYLRHEDARAHEALLCIQSGDSLKNPNHWKFDTDHFYFKTRRRCSPTSPARRTRCAARSRSPSAATSRSSSAASCCRTSRCPTAATPSTISSSCARRGSGAATTR